MKQDIHYFGFYPKDFLVGTMGMTNTQVGIYVKLLCIQFDSGPITLELIQQFSEGIQEDIDVVLKKFKKNKKGLFYNERLEVARKKANDSHQQWVEWGRQGGNKAKQNKDKNKGGDRVPTTLPDSGPGSIASVSEHKGSNNSSIETIESQTLKSIEDWLELNTEGE